MRRRMALACFPAPRLDRCSGARDGFCGGRWRRPLYQLTWGRSRRAVRCCRRPADRVSPGSPWRSAWPRLEEASAVEVALEPPATGFADIPGVRAQGGCRRLQRALGERRPGVRAWGFTVVVWPSQTCEAQRSRARGVTHPPPAHHPWVQPIWRKIQRNRPSSSNLGRDHGRFPLPWIPMCHSVDAHPSGPKRASRCTPTPADPNAPPMLRADRQTQMCLADDVHRVPMP